MFSEKNFDIEYKKLNPAQKEAVDSIDGPIMVVAGPGTGKTQVLALRIGYILKNTDTKADGILCLTFTNSGVKAMRERLRAYIGPEAGRVSIATFHSFGMDMIRKYFRVLDKDDEPILLDEQGAILLVDQILQNNPWEHISPRGDSTRYFRDLKSLISLLKRERITPDFLRAEIEKEIEALRTDPDSVSSRGSRKGELKKEVIREIEGLERTRETVKFYEIYESEKDRTNVLDYDDVLESLVKIVEESETAKQEIREEYLYVLIDEHQDSSGIQNQFLKAVWGETERPNIFVVGDDRQLIYGFGGASLEYFENFKDEFGKAKLITLNENYRSTQNILDSSHALLQSAIVSTKLKSNKAGGQDIRLVEADYPRDEIISAGLEIKKMLGQIPPEEVAILVPKNKQVRSAITILRDLGLPVSEGDKVDFFESNVAQSFIRVLRTLAYPESGVYVGKSLFDSVSGVDPISAHKFLVSRKTRDFNFLDLIPEKINTTLFGTEDKIEAWFLQLKEWLTLAPAMSLYSFVQTVGTELFLDKAENHTELTERVEVIRTVLHLVIAESERNSNITLRDFMVFLDRIEKYGESIPLAIFKRDQGVKVMTLHASKGLEFEFVWIAHLDEKSLAGGRHGGFTLPESIKQKTEERDDEVLKRQLYVAITRAKSFCTLSYARHGYTGGDQELAQVIHTIDAHLVKESANVTEDKILADDPASYVRSTALPLSALDLSGLIELVKSDYTNRKVSVSMLNNFFECPWKWYFRNMLQLPEPESPSLEFGNVVHSAIDEILKTGKVPEESHYFKLKESDQVKAKKISEHWFKTRYKEISKNYKNEESVSLSDERYPELSIYGKVDLIEIGDGAEVKVTDFKTGSGRSRRDIEKIDEEGRMDGYMRQLAMYSYLLSENSKWKKDVVESTLEFLEAKNPEDAFYRTYIDREKIEMLVRDITDYDNMLKTGTWVSRPCNFKSYGKANAVCEYCQIAKIYKK